MFNSRLARMDVKSLSNFLLNNEIDLEIVESLAGKKNFY